MSPNILSLKSLLSSFLFSQIILASAILPPSISLVDKIVDLRGDKKDDITNKWFIGKPLRVYYDYDVDGIWQEGDKFTYTTADGTEKEIQKGAKPGSAKVKDAEQILKVLNGYGTID